MATGHNWKRIPKSSKYKYVAKAEGDKGFIRWIASVCGVTKYHKTEKGAAKWVDLKLIDKGSEPVNILVRK
jgi:hypothetical protein